MAIITWSPSRLVDFEKCKFYAHLKHDRRIPEPERPLPPGKTEHANDRGSRIHNELELYVRGDGPMPREAAKFEDHFFKLRDLYETGAVSLEGEWGMDRGWNPCGWNGEWREATGPEHLGLPFVAVKTLPQYGRAGDLVKVGKTLYYWHPVWLRLKLDALVHLSETEAVVIDYKTGKLFGNEIKHGEQLQMYQLCTFLRFPKLEVVHTELWYLDVDDLTQKTFTRDQGLRFKRSFDMRGAAVTDCTDFTPKPNKFSCQWCRYGTKPGMTGDCKVGV